MQTDGSGAVGKSAPVRSADACQRGCSGMQFLSNEPFSQAFTMHGTVMLLKVSGTAFSPAAPASLVPIRSATLS
jgi:heme/copper-type cytochrome/quinol oxidase subunit 1